MNIVNNFGKEEMTHLTYTILNKLVPLLGNCVPEPVKFVLSPDVSPSSHPRGLIGYQEDLHKHISVAN